jgi:hypothetical protein
MSGGGWSAEAAAVADAYPGLAEALRLAYRQDGAISTAQARRAGLTKGQLAHLVQKGVWRRWCRGAYLVQGVHGLRGRVRAAMLGRPGSVACGITAARLLRFDGLPRERPDEPVHLLLPSATREQARGVVLHWASLPAEDVFDVGGIRATSPGRTLADLVLRARRAEAVALMDAALRAGHVTDLSRVRARTFGRHGSVARLEWWSLADGRAESPLETRIRLLLLDGGLPPPTPQWLVTDGRGWAVARLDLAWPEYRLDVEADGRDVHAEPRALYKDRDRQNALANLGWTMLRFTWSDVMARPQHTVQATATALRRAGWA